MTCLPVYRGHRWLSKINLDFADIDAGRIVVDSFMAVHQLHNYRYEVRIEYPKLAPFPRT